MNVPKSVINSLASLSGVLGMKERPFDSSVVCCLVRGLLLFGTGEAVRSDASLCVVCMFGSVFFRLFVISSHQPLVVMIVILYKLFSGNRN